MSRCWSSSSAIACLFLLFCTYACVSSAARTGPAVALPVVGASSGEIEFDIQQQTQPTVATASVPAKAPASGAAGAGVAIAAGIAPVWQHQDHDSKDKDHKKHKHRHNKKGKEYEVKKNNPSSDDHHDDDDGHDSEDGDKGHSHSSGGGKGNKGLNHRKDGYKPPSPPPAPNSGYQEPPAEYIFGEEDPGYMVKTQKPDQPKDQTQSSGQDNKKAGEQDKTAAGDVVDKKPQEQQAGSDKKPEQEELKKADGEEKKQEPDQKPEEQQKVVEAPKQPEDSKAPKEEEAADGVEEEQKPAEEQKKPADEVKKPAEEQKPVEAEKKPAEDANKPAEQEKKPAEEEEEEEEEEKPAKEKEPAEEKKKEEEKKDPVEEVEEKEEEKKPAQEEKKPVEEVQKPAEGDKKPLDQPQPQQEVPKVDQPASNSTTTAPSQPVVDKHMAEVLKDLSTQAYDSDSEDDDDSDDSDGDDDDEEGDGDGKGSSSKKHGHKSRKGHGGSKGDDNNNNDDADNSSEGGDSKSHGHKKHSRKHNKGGSSSGSEDKGGKGKKRSSSSNQPRYPQNPTDDSSDAYDGSSSKPHGGSDSYKTGSDSYKTGSGSDKGDGDDDSEHGGSGSTHDKHHKKHDKHYQKKTDAKLDGATPEEGAAAAEEAVKVDLQHVFASPEGDSNEDTPVPQPPAEVMNAFVGAGTFNWRALATQTAAESVSGLGESPYFPTLRGARKKHTPGAEGGSAGVSSPTFQLKVNNATADQGKGFFGTGDRDLESLPTDEALLVGPVEGGSDADRSRRYVLHAVNRVAEIFLAHSNGTLISGNLGLTRISLQNLMSVTSVTSVSSLVASEPTGYYDLQSKRYVLLWLATAPAQDAEPLMFVAVSQGSDPLGQWVVKGLRVKPSGITFKCGHAGSATEEPFFANYPQVTYNADGVYISLGLVCSASKGGGSASTQSCLSENFRSAILAISKTALYSTSSSSSSQAINAAVYIVAKAWYRSVSVSSSVVLGDTLNNFVQPVKPQTLEDVFNGPFFVQKVDDVYMSIGTISGGSLTRMTSLEMAPRLSAGLFARGHNFHNGAEYEGLNAMSQPETDIQLFAGDTGMVGRNFAVRSYGAMLYQGSIYLTTSEFYGSGSNRAPSVYWAIVEPGNLATGAITVHGAGIIASKDGMVLGFPVIAALSSGDGAVIAYAYAKSGEVNGVGPAYPGVATTTVRNFGRTGTFSIDIVKPGEGSITIPPVHDILQRWGDYSAVDVVDNKMWFAVPTTKLVGGKDPLVDAAYGTWISVKNLD